MEIEHKKEENVLIIKPITKNIDSAVSANFKGKVLDLVNKENNHVVLLLSEVDFIDSSGLGSLISILKTLTNNNRALAMCGIKPQILNLFSVTRLNRVFRIYPNEKEAIQALVLSKNDAR